MAAKLPLTAANALSAMRNPDEYVVYVLPSEADLVEQAMPKGWVRLQVPNAYDGLPAVAFKHPAREQVRKREL